MKRETKFRAYHIPTKRMFDVFSWCKDCVFEDSMDGVGTSPTLPAEMKDCELVQYMGLKDVHGKEIFEGDIVRWGMLNEISRECWHRYAVAEINPDIQFRILYYIVAKTGERKETDNEIFNYGNFSYKNTEKHLEIIGNIYENL